MAAVIHELWERDDSGLLIMPASVPIDAPAGAGGAHALPRGRVDAGDRSGRRRPERASAASSTPRTRTSGASARRGGSRARSTWARRRRSSRRTRGSTTARSSSAASSRASRRRPSATRCGGSRTARRTWSRTTAVLVRARADDQPDGADRAQSRFLEEHADEEIRRRLLAVREKGDFAGVHWAPRGPARCRMTTMRGSSCSAPNIRTPQARR